MEEASASNVQPNMAQGGMSVNGGTERYSHWTAMSPMEAPSELGGSEKMGNGNVAVNHWLSSQASDVSAGKVQISGEGFY